jgi:large subunit ribosomal protein L1
MAKHGKKFTEAAKLVDRSKQYNINEAVALLKKVSVSKFDSTVEVVFRLNIDPRHAEQQIRGALVLPNGSGKTQKVLVIADGAKEQEAKDAGADYVGGKDMLDKIQGGWFDFDVIVATPNMMGQLGRLGKVLGPKGLMPNPKTGTVTMEVGNAVNEIKKGKVTYRTDKDGNVQIIVGKTSFTDEQLVANYNAIYDMIAKSRPATIKGVYMKNVVLTATMAPGIKLEHGI